MSLSEAGPGLLGTYLTWEDLQQDFFELFGPEAVLGEEKTVKDIADGRVTHDYLGKPMKVSGFCFPNRDDRKPLERSATSEERSLAAEIGRQNGHPSPATEIWERAQQ